MQQQPCWTCAKATNKYLCPWAGGEPRKDWEATKIYKVCPTIHGKVRGYTTYDIKSCPSYKEDKR